MVTPGDVCMTVAPWSTERRERPAEAIRIAAVSHLEVLSFRVTDVNVERKRLARECHVGALDESLQESDDHSWTVDGSVLLSQAIDTENLRTRPAKGNRERVTGWSSRSRMRMMRKLGSVHDVGRMTMLTLTYDAEWTRTADGGWRTPAIVKRELDLFLKRLDHSYGRRFGGVWKMETQRRGAPHFHVGIVLADVDGDRRAQKVADREFAAFCRSAWHDIVAHGGRALPCTCWHRQFGADLDLRYADRVRNGRSTLAAYFAKHGTWASKEYQHDTPGTVIRRAMAVVGALAPQGGMVAGAPRPRSQFSGKRKIVTVWEAIQVQAPEMAEWATFADEWDHPGRWWATWGLVVAETARIDDLRSLTEGDSATASALLWRARLLVRKIVKRRTQRLVIVDESMRHCYVSRTLLSLHGNNDTGFWLMAKDGQRLMSWILHTAAGLLQFDGRELAAALAAVELPDTEPKRLRRDVAAVSASCR